MAEKADPVIDLVEEEEEEEWPEAGAQNMEEAEHYTDKINNIFRPSFGPHPRRHQNSTITNSPKFQESRDQAVGKHGGGQYRRSAQNNKGSNSIIPEAAFDGWGHRGGGPP